MRLTLRLRDTPGSEDDEDQQDAGYQRAGETWSHTQLLYFDPLLNRFVRSTLLITQNGPTKFEQFFCFEVVGYSAA